MKIEIGTQVRVNSKAGHLNGCRGTVTAIVRPGLFEIDGKLDFAGHELTVLR